MSKRDDVHTDDDALVLYALLIPGLITSVTHPDNPDGGIPIALYEDPPAGLRYHIDPWNMEIGEYVVVLVNGRPITSTGRSIDSTNLNERITGDLPKGLLAEGVSTLSYQVTRLSNNIEPSRDLKVLYHTLYPGDPAPQGLRLQLPADVLANGVSAALAIQGVVAGFDYTYRRALDVIRLNIGTVSIERTVTATEAAPTAPVVTRTLYTDVFERSGDNQYTPFVYSVTDQLGNRRGQSAVTMIDVHLKNRPVPLDLLAPKVLEAREANGTRLNFERDFYEADHATVEVDYIGSAPGQTVKVYWIGRNHTYGSEIQSIRVAGEKLTFRVPRLEVVDTIGSGAEIYYTVRLPGTSDDLDSNRLDITVTAQKYHLPEPTLSAARDNARTYYPTLDGNYTVRLRLYGIQTRDSAEIPITRPSYTDIAVNPLWIAENRNRDVIFNYTLRKGTEPIIFSWCLRVRL